MNLIERLKKLFSEKKDENYHCYHIKSKDKSWVVWCNKLDSGLFVDGWCTVGYDVNGNVMFNIKEPYTEWWLWNTETDEAVSSNPYDYDELMKK